MSRIRKCIAVAGGASAGLLLAALASSATASADTATPMIPGLSGVLEQFISAPAASIPQLLQSTASALAGAPALPASPPPGVSASINLPQLPTAAAQGTPGGASTLPGFPAPGALSSVLPFPLPNLGGTTASVPAPSVNLPGAFLPPAVAAAPTPAPLTLISGLP